MKNIIKKKFIPFIFIIGFLLNFSLILAMGATNAKNLGKFENPGGWNNGTDAPETKLEKIISAIIGLITIVASLFFVIQIFLAGLGYISAGGDSGKIETAKLRMQQSAIGLGIVLLAYSVLAIVGIIMGIDLLNPAQSIDDIFR